MVRIWQKKKKFNYWNLCAKACGKLKKRGEKRAIVIQRGVIKAINMLQPVRDLKNAKIRAHVQVTVVSVYNCVQKIKTYKLAANLCSPVSPRRVEVCASQSSSSLDSSEGA